jgi:hypothetical protein
LDAHVKLRDGTQLSLALMMRDICAVRYIIDHTISIHSNTHLNMKPLYDGDMIREFTSIWDLVSGWVDIAMATRDALQYGANGILIFLLSKNPSKSILMKNISSLFMTNSSYACVYNYMIYSFSDRIEFMEYMPKLLVSRVMDGHIMPTMRAYLDSYGRIDSYVMYCTLECFVSSDNEYRRSDMYKLCDTFLRVDSQLIKDVLIVCAVKNNVRLLKYVVNLKYIEIGFDDDELLHVACRHDSHEVIESLMIHPGVNVSSRDDVFMKWMIDTRNFTMLNRIFESNTISYDRIDPIMRYALERDVWKEMELHMSHFRLNDLLLRGSYDDIIKKNCIFELFEYLKDER